MWRKLPIFLRWYDMRWVQLIDSMILYYEGFSECQTGGSRNDKETHSATHRLDSSRTIFWILIVATRLILSRTLIIRVLFLERFANWYSESSKVATCQIVPLTPLDIFLLLSGHRLHALKTLLIVTPLLAPGERAVAIVLFKRLSLEVRAPISARLLQ